MRFSFDRFSDEDVILVNVLLDNRVELRLAFDTAATHTTFDINVLYFSDYQLNEKIGSRKVETSNGQISVDVYELNAISAIGISKINFPVQVYDFLAHGIVSEYDGVLGLDFLKEECFCVNLLDNYIEVKS